jgi:MFS family permease
MSFFAFFTFICGLSPTFIGLVIARAFQGIGAAFTIPSAQAFISLTFPDPKSRAFALGIWGASASAGFVVGLILGGILTDFLGWRWVFWISLMISGVVIPSACLILPQTNPQREEEEIRNTQPHERTSRSDSLTLRSLCNSILRRLVRFDALGITLGLPGILLLNYSFSAANTVGWGKGEIIGTLIVSVIMLCAFVYHEHRASVSLVPTQLFRIPSFNVNLILAAMAFAIRQSCTYFLTLQLQSYGNSPIHTAVLFIPLGVAAVISIFFSGKLLSAIGPKRMFILGHVLALPGVILFSFVTSSSNYWAFTFPGMVLYIVGIGFVYVTANFVAVSSARKTDQGTASALFNVALQVGGSVLGLAVLTAVAEGISKRYGTERGARVNEVGYRAVYYSCAILCVLGLILSVLGTQRKTGMEVLTPPVEEDVREADASVVGMRLDER